MIKWIIFQYFLLSCFPSSEVWYFQWGVGKTAGSIITNEIIHSLNAKLRDGKLTDKSIGGNIPLDPKRFLLISFIITIMIMTLVMIMMIWLTLNTPLYGLYKPYQPSQDADKYGHIFPKMPWLAHPGEATSRFTD